MASADKEDIKRMYLLYNILENLGKYNATSIEDFEHFEEEEKKIISRIFNSDGEIDRDELIEYLYGLTFGFHRVVMGYEVLFDNCADPSLSHLDFNENIKSHFGLVEILGEDLRAKGTNVITADSEAGKKILQLTEEEGESSNV